MTLEELLAFVRERGGIVRAEELEAAFGAPKESLRDWAEAHRVHLKRLAEAHPAPEER